MLKLFKSFQPSLALAIAISSVSMGAFVQANPIVASHDLDSVSSPLTTNSNTPIRRYGSSHVALDTKIETVSGDAEVALAEHLAKSGAKFYGAQWCTHRSEERRVGKEC